MLSILPKEGEEAFYFTQRGRRGFLFYLQREKRFSILPREGKEAFYFTCRDILCFTAFSPSSDPVDFLAAMVYSLSDFLLDDVMSTFFAEDWFLDAVTDVPAGELTFVASAVYKFKKAD